MIEARVRNYLISCNISGIEGNVFLMRPETIPTTGKYLLVEKLSSSPTDMLFTTRFAIQSINTASDYVSAAINEDVINSMLNWNEDGIGVKLINSIPYHNSQTKEYRYQAIFEIYHY